ncbi:MAG: metallophosphoesterase [Lachnospiraceae bacterium]|nr:metallophosphoesterase [Lachnospiraceae bacterium]
MSFIFKTYDILSEKAVSPMTILFLSDLHGRLYGTDGQELANRLAKTNPDLILIGGDLIVRRDPARAEVGCRLLEKLAQIAPCYMAPGNHESRAFRPGETDPTCLENRDRLMQALKTSGVPFLRNEKMAITIGGNPLCLYGYEAPLETYEKFRRPVLEKEALTTALGHPDDTSFNILLAHNPSFVPQYLDWGADLTLCGHFHGGFMRLTQRQVLISPYGFPFPKYGYGRYDGNGGTAIVTSGLGEHVLPFRIHNPYEAVLIRVRQR